MATPLLGGGQAVRRSLLTVLPLGVRVGRCERGVGKSFGEGDQEQHQGGA